MARDDVGAFLVHEIRGLVPPMLFFLVAFNLLALTAQLSSSGATFGYATACVSALICAKAVLIADNRLLPTRWPARPLIWNVAWKALFYALLSTAIGLLDHGVRGWLGDRHLGAGAEQVIAGFNWPHFVMIQVWLATLFLVYATFAEMIAAIGRERMRRLFFGPVEAAVV